MIKLHLVYNVVYGDCIKAGTKFVRVMSQDWSWVEFIGVLRHMQRYFSHICDGTDMQADWSQEGLKKLLISKYRGFCTKDL